MAEFETRAAREAERRYPKRTFVRESYVQNAFIAGAEWASHAVDGGREGLYDALEDHFDGIDRDGDYDGTCSCGWSEPEGWNFYGSTNTWREHLADAMIAAGYRKAINPRWKRKP